MSSDKLDVVQAVAELVKAVPVYEDALQPAAKELGTALHTVARAINVALSPVAILVWGYDRIREYVLPELAERLKDVSPDKIVTPDPAMAGPLIEALRFVGIQDDLRELYVNLLSAAMNKETVKYAHPAFVEILKQLSSDEARIVGLFLHGQNFPVITIESRKTTPLDPNSKSTKDWVLRNFSLLPYKAKCKYPELGPSYLDNLCRLGLAVIPDGGMFTVSTTTPDRYPPLIEHTVIQDVIAEVNSRPNEKAEIDHQVIRVTTFGKQFVNAVVRDSPPEALTK